MNFHELTVIHARLAAQTVWLEKSVALIALVKVVISLRKSI